MTMPIAQSSSTGALPVLYRDRELETSPLLRSKDEVRISDDGSFSVFEYVDVSSRPAQPRASRAVRLREWIYEKFPRFAAFTGIARARSELASAKDQLGFAKIDAADVKDQLEVAKTDLAKAKEQLAVMQSGLADMTSAFAGARFELAELNKELEIAKCSARMSELHRKRASNNLQIERDVSNKLTDKVTTLKELMGNGLEWDSNDISDSGRDSSDESRPRSDPEEHQTGFRTGMPVFFRKAVNTLMA